MHLEKKYRIKEVFVRKRKSPKLLRQVCITFFIVVYKIVHKIKYNQYDDLIYI